MSKEIEILDSIMELIDKQNKDIELIKKAITEHLEYHKKQDKKYIYIDNTDLPETHIKKLFTDINSQ